MAARLEPPEWSKYKFFSSEIIVVEFFSGKEICLMEIIFPVTYKCY